MTTMKIQNIKSHLLRSLLVVVMMICGVGEAAGQAPYVITSNGYYMAVENGQLANPTEFNPNTCIWTLDNNGVLSNSGKYLAYTTVMGFPEGVVLSSSNSCKWTLDGAKLKVKGKWGSYYLCWNSNQWDVTVTSGSAASVYSVTSVTVDASGTINVPMSVTPTELTWPGGAGWSQIQGYVQNPSADEYRAGYVTYTFNGVNHYWYSEKDHDAIPPTIPNFDKMDATWALDGDGQYFVNITQNQKYYFQATFDEEPSEEVTLRVRYNLSYQGDIVYSPYVDVTLKPGNSTNKVEKPVVSFNPETKKVSISCDTKDAIIRYTTDGSAPGSSSTLYSEQFEISKPTVIKAVASKNGMTNSATGICSVYSVEDTSTNGYVKINYTLATQDTPINLEAKPDAGYILDSWLVYQGTTEQEIRNATGNTCSFNMPAGNVEVTAVFIPKPCTVTLSVDPEGSGSVIIKDTENDEVSVFIYDETYTLVPTPSDGYDFSSWTVNSGGVTIGSDNKFTMPDEDVSITANFTAKTFNITIDNSISGGTISNIPGFAEYKTNVSLEGATITPNPGYKFSKWVVTSGGQEITVEDNNKLNNPPAHFEMPAGDVVVSAVFAELQQDPTSLSVTETMEMNVGESQKISPNIEPSGNTYKDDIRYASADGNIATVTADGTVTGVAAGQTTITVTAYKQDGTTNADLTKTVTVTVMDKVVTPTITFTTQSTGSDADVTFECSTEDVDYYYTTDGVTDPTTTSTKHNGSLSVSNGTIVKVIAVKTGDDAQYFDNSDVATAQYTAQKVPTPEIRIRGNEVTFTCDEPGVTFYYTTNGNDPTTSSTQWNRNTITGLANNTTIKVIATKDGFANSDVATKVYHSANVVYLRLAGARGKQDGSSVNNEVGSWANAFAKLGYGPNAKYLRSQWKANNVNGLQDNDTGLSDNTDYTSTVDNNIIYLVGDVSESDFSTLMGKTKSDPTSESDLMSTIVKSGFFKPVTISGKYANSNSNTEKYARISINSGTKYTLNEDMRFEYVEFHGDNGTNSTDFMQAYYDLEMGEGIFMTNFLSTKDFSTYHHGYAQGVTNAAHILFYGGLTCDKRFGTDPNGALNFDYYLPHPDGYKITIRSGYFSTISPGGTQWSNTTSLNGTMGSPNTPIKCTITIDIDRAWNTAHQSEVLGKTANGNPDCDVAVVIAGTHEGTMYGDVDINIKSGRIDRVVNGTFGANNFVSNHPADSYFGRASILIDPREPSTAEKTYVADKNSMVVIRELYGGGLGRFKSDSSKDNQSSTYFYGKSSVVINGGTFSSALYASGAGGVNGVGDDNHHTPDQKLPYWTGTNNNTIAYGTYDNFIEGRAKKPFVVKCRNADGTTEEVDLYNTSARIEIHGGVFGTASSPASIYGGGYGFVDTELINYNNNCKPNTRAGAIFAAAGQQASSITIDGDAEIYGNVYGAGRGDDTYKNAGITYNSDDYTKLGHVYGNVALSIGGNAKIHGNVYGAGQGIDKANFGNMARLYGSASLIVKDNATISGSVYGGGANGATDGTTTVNVSGGTISGDVYGGGALANTGNTKVNLLGGTVKDVYGGGLGRTEGRAVAATVGTSIVNVGSSSAAGATVINGAVFGCNNLNGYPTSTAVVNVYKTAARASGTYHLEAVYGGGNQAAYTGNPTVNVLNNSVENVYGGGLGSTAIVTGSPEVNIYGGTIGSVFGGGSEADTSGGTEVNIEGGTVVTAVYGGGALANTGNTKVNLLGGTVKDVYGGGLGNESVAAKVGSTEVNVGKDKGSTDANGMKETEGTCVITGDVFGCNNFNGTPTGEAIVNVYKTNARPGAATGAYHVNQVFGGGNNASYDPNPDAKTNCTIATHVNVYTCNNSIAYVYGGGNAASTPATNVYIQGGRFNYIFGGGNGRGTNNPGANVGYYTDTDINDVTSHGAPYGTGRANTEIYGGVINHLFGGSNTRGNIRYAAISQLEDQSCEFQIGEAYSAGNEAYMDGTAEMHIGCIPGMAALYGGAKAANINSDVTLTITSGTYGQVFGGNNDGGMINGKITVNIEETGCHEIIIGEVYGGGNQAAYPGTLPSNYTANPTGITVNAKSFTKIGAIYGGGYGAQATVTGNTTVNVNMVKGKHASSIENKLGTVGNIYGGGNAAKVDGNTNVNIGTANEVTFVSTDGTTSWSATKTVEGANVQPVTVTIPKEIAGTTNDVIYTGDGNVFGGGNNAEVTGTTNVTIGANKQ